MKTIALLLSTLALAAATVEWNDLRVTWNLTSRDPQRTNSFFEIPRTLQDAVSAGWVEAEGVEQSLQVSTYCLTDDPRFCVLFDSYGFVAGVQAGVLVSDVENMQEVYDMSRLSEYKIRTMFGQKIWTAVAYTQNPVVIAAGGRSSTWDYLTGIEGLWLDSSKGYIEVPRDLDDLNSMWVENACVPGQGTHHNLNLDDTTNCADIEPWFVLYNGGFLTGLGFYQFGDYTIKSRHWYEPITSAGLRYAIPNGPQCLFDWADLYHAFAMHIFFTAEPWNIQCT